MERQVEQFDVWKPYLRYCQAQRVYEKPSKDTLRIEGPEGFIFAASLALWEIACANLTTYLDVIRHVPAIVYRSLEERIRKPEGWRWEACAFSIGPDDLPDGLFRYVDNNSWASKALLTNSLVWATVYAMGYHKYPEIDNKFMEVYGYPAHPKAREIEELRWEMEAYLESEAKRQRFRRWRERRT